MINPSSSHRACCGRWLSQLSVLRERVAGSTTHGQPEVNFAFNRIQFWVDLFLILQDLHSFRSQRSTDLIPEADSDFKPHFKVLSRCSLQSPKRHAESDLSSFPFSKVPQGSIITVQIRIKRARAQDATLERKRERERQEIFLQICRSECKQFFSTDKFKNFIKMHQKFTDIQKDLLTHKRQSLKEVPLWGTYY